MYRQMFLYWALRILDNYNNISSHNTMESMLY